MWSRQGLSSHQSRRSPRVRYRHWIFKLPLARNYRGMVVGRTILFKGDESEVSRTLFQHELLHQEQIDRHGIARFYFIYLRDYLANLWRLRNHDAAYRNIPFEKEAFERESETGEDDDHAYPARRSISSISASVNPK